MESGEIKTITSRSVKGVGLFFATLITLFLLGGVWIVSQIPSTKTIRGCLTTALYHVHLCPGSKDYAPLREISPFLQKAVVLSEDSAFYTHHGFDFQEMQKSFEKNLETGRFARGGSTISQQLAKNMFLSAEKTVQRKALEAIITLQIEKSLSKNEILERYLNVVEFGPEIYGVKAAAAFYFKKTPAQLDVIESAWLAFLLPNPDKYSVSFYRKSLTPFAHKRLHEIIQRLYQYQRIGEDDFEQAGTRLASFMSGGAPPKPPADMDLNAPEEAGMPAEDNDEIFKRDLQQLQLESTKHTTNSEATHQDRQDDQNAEVNEQPDLGPTDEQSPSEVH